MEPARLGPKTLGKESSQSRIRTCGSGSNIGTRNGPLANGTKDYHLRWFGGVIYPYPKWSTEKPVVKKVQTCELEYESEFLVTPFSQVLIKQRLVLQEDLLAVAPF